MTFSSLFLLYLPSGHTTNLDRGAEIYSNRCVLCHGNKGMGDGYIPMRLKGYPQTSLFEIQKVKDKQSLIEVISKGLLTNDINKYMPPWESELTTQNISDLADFVLYLREDTEGAMNRLFTHTSKINRTVKDGRIIFNTRCVLCHGKEGKGDGRMSRIIKSPPPANLTASTLTAAQMSQIIKLGGQGVKRSPQMPPWGDFLTENEVDAVVIFIKTLKQ
ncbi:c-type cytochrome [Shewanella sp. D64]|uniref:c-type cytochrome n=1 Tax=unclassified Shewanella TaxID=196818 RepID=UPI0022BA2C3B|nr:MULTISPECIES: c-type cytochrome [unclassified Shewanella]MEC4724044.1 c-type cytochrome [Shewanella sp. D64]MEC4736064.1 c-type cytochrome [Shewanella sp. E94]WBJ97992.1 c-type cytochrome [Shewanella sp. MTB7]